MAIVDTAVMVQVMHHLADVPAALTQIRRTIASGGVFVAEYANKRHLKSVARYALRRQSWNPFHPEPVEFVTLNFDFHPDWMTEQLGRAGFEIEQELAVSHFRIPQLKRWIPARYLAAADGAIQGPGARWKLTPSVFVRCKAPGRAAATLPSAIFQCPECAGPLLDADDALNCQACGQTWPMRDGIYDFKDSIGATSRLVPGSPLCVATAKPLLPPDTPHQPLRLAIPPFSGIIPLRKKD